eukprot:scaffold66598_cov66-Phaeocystis_antarctica.AAC.4
MKDTAGADGAEWGGALTTGGGAERTTALRALARTIPRSTTASLQGETYYTPSYTLSQRCDNALTLGTCSPTCIYIEAAFHRAARLALAVSSRGGGAGGGGGGGGGGDHSVTVTWAGSV